MACVVGILLAKRPEVVMVFLALSMAALIWMAIRILRDPYSTDKTFDEQFYQDRDDIRRVSAK